MPSLQGGRVPEEIATSWLAGWRGWMAVGEDTGSREIVAVKAALAMTERRRGGRPTRLSVAER